MSEESKTIEKSTPAPPNTPTNELANESSVNESTQEEMSRRHTGRVKWFGKGFGFIVDVYDESQEYFVHHTKLEINPESEKQTRIYRKLELGEYVNFNVREEGDRMSAVCVTGVNEGPLMCESVALERRDRPEQPPRSQQRQQQYQRRPYQNRHSVQEVPFDQ